VSPTTDVRVTEVRATDILVVDDELDIRTSSAEILRGVGYRVEEAGDGREALELLADHPVGAMVLDIRMPKLDGLAVVAALADPPPIVLVSAHTLDEADRKQVEGKVAAFLRKPVPPARLIEQVQLALQGGRAS
jgi:CheY-like chemotaxis protein